MGSADSSAAGQAPCAPGPLVVNAGASHPAHNEIREWPDGRDPNSIDELQVKISLGRIARRRNLAKARINQEET